MGRFLAGVLTALALCGMLAAMDRPAERGSPGVLAFAIAPQEAASVANARTQASTQQAQIAADLAATVARERTVRLGIAVVAIMCGGVALAFASRPRQRTYIMLPPDPYEFAAMLQARGGEIIDGTPWFRGERVKQLEWEE